MKKIKKSKIFRFFLVFIMLFTYIDSFNSIVFAEQEQSVTDTEYETLGYIVETDEAVLSEEGLVEEKQLYGAAKLTDESVFNSLIAFEESYPEGMLWTNENSYGPYYHYSDERVLTYTGYGCAAFTFILSDGVFGNLPDREHHDWNNIRVGDIIRVNNNTHSVIVLSVSGDDITVAEGNYNSRIRWGRVLSRSRLAAGMGTYIWTRWPDMSLKSAGIYCSSTYPAVTLGMVAQKSYEDCDVEYRWTACDESNPDAWYEIRPWTTNYEWVNWTPEKSGNYIVKCVARVIGSESATETSASVEIQYHKNIKGICQMPYDGDGGGYLIGIESYDNPNNSYQYEMLILDCTLYAQGLPAWTYTTGKCGAPGNCLWTVWQPQYGYYWTLFRIFDKDGNMIDEACYGFENVY